MRMDNSPAQVIARLLADLGLGVTPPAAGDWPVYATNEPPSPDNVITVYNTRGSKTKYNAGGRTGDDGRVLGKLEGTDGIQIRVRSTGPSVGWDKLNEVVQVLVETYRRMVTVGDHTYLFHCVSNVGDVLDIGKEAPTSKRNLFTANMTASIQQCS